MANIKDLKNNLSGIKEETFNIHVKFPNDYGVKNLNGQPATFKVKLKSIAVKKEAKLNDSWVKKHSDSSKTVKRV